MSMICALERALFFVLCASPGGVRLFEEHGGGADSMQCLVVLEVKVLSLLRRVGVVNVACSSEVSWETEPSSQ